MNAGVAMVEEPVTFATDAVHLAGWRPWLLAQGQSIPLIPVGFAADDDGIFILNLAFGISGRLNARSAPVGRQLPAVDRRLRDRCPCGPKQQRADKDLRFHGR